MHGRLKGKRKTFLLKQDLLNYELNQKASLPGNFPRSYKSLLSFLETTSTPLDFKYVCSTIERKDFKIKDRNFRKLDNKFNNLKRMCFLSKLAYSTGVIMRTQSPCRHVK